MDKGSEVPEGWRDDARETWPSHDLIESWLGDSMYDFQFRPGEDTFVDADDPEADPAEAAAGTIRRLFAESKERNAVHGSDSPENARREIGFFFTEGELSGMWG